MRYLRQEKGLTLVELAIAILILSIGTLAAMRGFDHAIEAADTAEARAVAQIAVRNRAEELRLLGPDAVLPETVTIAGHDLSFATERSTTAGGLIRIALTAQARGRAGAQLVVFLPPGFGG